MINRKTTIGLILLLLGAQGLAIANEKQSVAIVNQAIEKVFVPAVVALEKHTSELQSSLRNDCRGDKTRDAFKSTVAVFSEIEYYRLGVVNQNNRAERLFFWPDRKATGQKQMRRLLKDPKRDQLDANSLSKKSVALQGLPALERILFASTEDSTGKDCKVASAIVGNMQNIAAQMKNDWQAADGISNQLLEGSQQSLYRNSTEAMAAILTLSDSALLVLSDKKLSLILKGLEQAESIPKSAPFWRSDMTLRHLSGNLNGIENLLRDGGFARVAGVESPLKFEFRTAHTMLDAARDAYETGDIETMSSRLLAVQLIVQGLRAMVLETISPALGVVTGFNSSDGD